MKIKFILFLLILFTTTLNAQLKFIVEDFEGLADGFPDLKKNGIFTYGNIKASIEQNNTAHPDNSGVYLGGRSIKLIKEGNLNYGGWGKGIGLNVELDVEKDYLNFYVLPGKNINIKIELQEDDNADNTCDKNLDDSWIYVQKLDVINKWQLVSIPLTKFQDTDTGGNSLFDINYKKGKLLTMIISFIDEPLESASKQTNAPAHNIVASFDFICFSKGKLPTGTKFLDAPLASDADNCSLGSWSKEGNTADFIEIAKSFENTFKSNKKLGVVHFFQPFAVDGGNTQNFYPSVERINKVIQQGYIPMITLEDHFVNSNPKMKQPNLYSIVEGHLDVFFADWAKQIKQVDGVVLLRILHEFNGDWYPWCIVNNDKNPKLLIKAYQHIHNIFASQNVTNVKFIWCPNSMSMPQESWNFIMDAYPGDEYVDFVGLDIYNGAGKGSIWRSFRKEGIENYFLLTQMIPNKPLLVCETASREREGNEAGPAQNKGEWIKQMSEALTTDMSKIKLLTLFNEKSTFKINSSSDSQKAFLNYILKNDYFGSGTEFIYPILKH